MIVFGGEEGFLGWFRLCLFDFGVVFGIACCILMSFDVFVGYGFRS